MTSPTAHPETRRAKKRVGGKLDGSMNCEGRGNEGGMAKEAGKI